MVKDERLLERAEQYKLQFKSVRDFTQQKDEHWKNDVTSKGENLSPELYMMQQMNQDLIEMLKVSEIHKNKLDFIYDGIKRLVGRLPDVTSTYKTNRALNKANVKDQLHRNLCVD